MRVVEKPWGNEIIFAETKDYVGKILTIRKGHRLSRQFHLVKDETFYVRAGELKLEIGLPMAILTHVLKAGETFHCPPNTVHRMIAETSLIEIIEVSTPQLDDVIRIEDDYGR